MKLSYLKYLEIKIMAQTTMFQWSKAFISIPEGPFLASMTKSQREVKHHVETLF